ncbi:zinc-finger domain-containing protein [Metabacillus litoralis]|uniref:Zinc-finger domain-containing protein n=1 Tax=Metabacillus litoralis TaxID=152268 RepID=A0A5C6W9P9_9BACI|nr:zinc-finger domain-containing protein [Metabacillus litoralis]TXC93218.1 zinc-finger domain-containing protein [Metabacillus litoralis]
MSKKQTLQELSEIIDTYCVDCLVKKHLREESGKRFAHSFCINQCTVGLKIKNVGKKLT